MEVTLKSTRWALVALTCSVAALPALAQTPKTRAAAPAPTTRAARPAASAQQLDGIAAVVNNDIVLQSDVEEQLYLFVTRNQLRPDSMMLDTLRLQILDEMINEKVIYAEAVRQGMTASDVEVSREVEKALRDAKQRLGEDGFREQLAKENLTEEQLRARYRDEARRQQLAQRLVQKSLPNRPVSQAEAEAYFRANPDKFPLAPGQVRVSVIQIPVSPDSAADAAGHARILEIRRRLAGGEKFAKLAAELSDDTGSARAGGDLGFFTRGSMEPALEQASFSLPLGRVSEPVHTPYGWHLIEPIERDTLKTVAGRDSLDPDGKAIPEAHARHILIRVPTTDADRDRARALAERVRGELVNGMDFGTMVRRYSKYPGPAGPDGDIGFISLGTLMPQIRAGLDTLELGQISESLENQAGFNIFRINERKAERPYELDEIKDQLPEFVAQLKFKDRYAEWVKGLRAKAVIEIR
jgi:peptidyl-prolyl cis-trans isomerase SurA